MKSVDMDATAKLPSRWAGVGETLPQSLEQLAGPSDGIVELPFDLAWSGRRSFDLSDEGQRYLYQMTVLTVGFEPEHYTGWLNSDLLRSDWSRLLLPRQLRDVWQDHFPELRAVIESA
jgi:hypothetical protein